MGRPRRMVVAWSSLLRTADVDRPLREYDEAAYEGFDIFRSEHGENLAGNRLPAWLPQSNQQNATVCSWAELPHIGEVEVLGNEEALLPDGRFPDHVIGVGR